MNYTRCAIYSRGELVSIRLRTPLGDRCCGHDPNAVSSECRDKPKRTWYTAGWQSRLGVSMMTRPPPEENRARYDTAWSCILRQTVASVRLVADSTETTEDSEADNVPENVTVEDVHYVENVLLWGLPSNGSRNILDRLILVMNFYVPADPAHTIFNSREAKAEFVAKVIVEFQNVRPIHSMRSPAFPRTTDIDERYLDQVKGFLGTSGFDWVKQLLQPVEGLSPSLDGQDASRIPPSDPGQELIASSNSPPPYISVELGATHVGGNDGHNRIPVESRTYQQAGLLEEGGRPRGRGINRVGNNRSDDLGTRLFQAIFWVVVVLIIVFFIL